MQRLLEFVNLNEAVQIVALIALLGFLGMMTAPPRSRARLWAKRAAALSFLGFAALAISREHPQRAGQFLDVATRALLAAGLMMGIGTATFPVILRLNDAVNEALERERERHHQIEQAKRAAERAVQQRQEEQERLARKREKRRREAAARPPSRPFAELLAEDRAEVEQVYERCCAAIQAAQLPEELKQAYLHNEETNRDATLRELLDKELEHLSR